MQQDDLALTFQTVERDKNLLLKNIWDEDLLSFLIKWFLFSENQTKKQEQRYIWSLIHGWSISELAERKTAEPEGSVDEVQICQNKEKFQFQSEKISSSRICLNFLSSNEAVIKESSTLFWINPSSLDKDILTLATSLQTFIVVLSSSHSSHLLHILGLISMKIVFKVITLEPIYNKIKILLNFLKKREPQKYAHLILGKFYFLKANEYFEYGGFLWQPINCCWYQPQYDLLIAPNRAKHESFLLESSKVTQTKYIYYGWKKGFITEENYQRYTGTKPEGIITPKDQLFHQITKIDVPQLKEYEYLHFKKKQFIRDIDDQDQEEIWNCLEELSMTAGQVVVRKGTIFDHIFILFQGQFQVEYEGSKQNPANKALLYGLQDLRKDLSHCSFTLKCIRAGTVKRIEKENFRCIMYDYLF